MIKKIIKSFFFTDKLVKKSNFVSKYEKEIARKILNSCEFVKKQKTSLEIKLNEQNKKIDINCDFIKQIVEEPQKTKIKDNLIEINIEPFENPEEQENKKLKKFLTLNLENKKKNIIPGVFQKNKSKKIKNKVEYKLNNFFIGDKYLEKELIELIKVKKISKVLIASDSFSYRYLNIYKNIVEKLNQLNIEYVEFTNIQPNLDRKLIFKFCNFASKNNINSVFVIGSNSTIDFVNTALPKLLKPNIIRLQRYTRKVMINPNFSIFCFPTIVSADEKTNSKQIIKNRTFFKNLDYFGDTIFLPNSINNSDVIFYSPKLILELSHSKQIELLHETFFRLIFNYFDERSLLEDRLEIIANIKTINWYTNYVYSKNTLNQQDAHFILKIISQTVNGSCLIDDEELWTIYKLEANLSLQINSKKSDGLALFFPSFLEYLHQYDNVFSERLKELGKLLYKSESCEGVIFNILKYNEKYNLPLRMLDIPNLLKIDYKFLIYIVKKSSPQILSFKFTKIIVKNIAIW